jgi:hypothetical protein
MQRLRHKLQRGLYNYWQLYIQHALPVAVYTTGRVGSTSHGFISFTSGNYSVLIQQLEQDNALRSKQVAEFLALSDFTIRRDNVRSEKSAGGGYEDFKKQVIVLPQHLDTVYKSDYAKYCYTPSQIEAFRENWKG